MQPASCVSCCRTAAAWRCTDPSPGSQCQGTFFTSSARLGSCVGSRMHLGLKTSGTVPTCRASLCPSAGVLPWLQGQGDWPFLSESVPGHPPQVPWVQHKPHFLPALKLSHSVISLCLKQQSVSSLDRHALSTRSCLHPWSPAQVWHTVGPPKMSADT